jgi:uncharacterized membrane protein YkoI
MEADPNSDRMEDQMKHSQFRLLAAVSLLAALALPAAAARQETKTTEKKETKVTERTEAQKASAPSAVSADQAAMQREAKISMARARAIALKRAPGKITSAELERENGRLIYSFDIKTSGSGVTEVNVNAMTGRIVDAHHESAAKEAAEKKMEAKEKKH